MSDLQLLRKHAENILVPHTAFQKGLRRLEQGLFSVGGGEPLGFSVIGESRCGKTTLVKYFASQHLPYRDEDGLKTPILIATTPSKPTIKSLAAGLLMGLGDPLAEIRETESQRTLRLLKFIKSRGTKCIILDEIQHFVERYGDKVMYQVADWLKIVLDEAGVMIVASGLPYSNSILLQNEQLRGRFVAGIKLPRFDWKDEQSRLEFRAMLNAFGTAMHPFSLPDLGSEEMAYRFFLASGGLTGYVVKLLKQASWSVLDEGRIQIHLSDFKEAYEDAIWDDSGTSGPNPFGRAITHDQSALEHAEKIGLARLEQNRPRRGRKPKGPAPLQGVL